MRLGLSVNHKNTVYLIGSGIKSISHLTVEAQACIKQADKVLYLVNEPIIEQWIVKYSNHCSSLEDLYFSANERSEKYQLISDKIVSDSLSTKALTVVFYGHPTVFAEPGLKAIKVLDDLNVNTVVLPAISAEDCLFADLRIDPGENGCYSVEASDLLIYDKNLIKDSDCIIWQVGSVGNIQSPTYEVNNIGINLLIAKLEEYYPKEYIVYIYEAAMYPSTTAYIQKCKIKELGANTLTPLSTLYIPAIKRNPPNLEIIRKLGLQDKF